MRRLVFVSVAWASLLAAGAAASAELDPRVKESVDRATAAEKAAIGAADLAKQAVADAAAASKIAIERAGEARALPDSALGQLTPREGVKVQGQMRDGKVDGLCIVQFPTGLRYEGECRNSTIHGYGVQSEASGFRYEGSFEGNQRQGSGRSVRADGTRYEGQWLKSQWAGYGAVRYASGDTFSGHLAQSKPEGSGVRKTPDGGSYLGDWRDGRAEGYGVHVLAGGNFYMGQWTQNKYNGIGLFGSRTDKKVTQGMWDTGILKQELGPQLAYNPPGGSRSSTPKPATPPEKAPPAATGPKGSGPRLAANGTGFYVSKAGHIVTNDHVTRGCASLRVHAVGEPSLAVRLLATSQPQDLSLLKTEGAASSVATIRSGSPLRLGDAVVVFGFPLTGLVASSGNLTTGNVTALAGIGDATDVLQISAPVQPGNSGGPLMDLSANIIGVVEAKLDAAKVASKIGDIPQNINFAIKASVLTSFLDAHGVRYETAQSAQSLSVADVGDKARAFTVFVECYK
jgi:hypothetical protein